MERAKCREPRATYRRVSPVISTPHFEQKNKAPRWSHWRLHRCCRTVRTTKSSRSIAVSPSCDAGPRAITSPPPPPPPLDRDGFGHKLAIIGYLDNAVRRLAAGLEVDLDTPLVVPLSKIETVPVNGSFPLLGAKLLVLVAVTPTWPASQPANSASSAACSSRNASKSGPSNDASHCSCSTARRPASHVHGQSNPSSCSQDSCGWQLHRHSVSSPRGCSKSNAATRSAAPGSRGTSSTIRCRYRARNRRRSSA
jgi:hypothetical protein